MQDNSGTGAVSGLLRAWSKGDREAGEKLLPLVYEELRRRAAAYLRRERTDHTLQPTALVNEAYLRLIGQERVAWQNRAHFFGVAAVRVALDERAARTDPPDCELLLLDQALDELAVIDPQQARIVELRYFGGLSEGEVAGALSVSRSTVTREWRIARGWLYRRITTGRERGLA